MANAMPDNTENNEEPRHLSDSENELLSLEEEEDGVGQVAVLDVYNPDDELLNSSSSDGEDPQAADSDYTPGSPDQESHHDTGQVSESGRQDDDHQDTDTHSDQNISMDSGLLDEKQSELNDDEGTSENINENEGDLLNEEEDIDDGSQEMSIQEDTMQDEGCGPEGPTSPEPASDEGPRSPEPASDEGPRSPEPASDEGPRSPEPASDEGPRSPEPASDEGPRSPEPASDEGPRSPEPASDEGPRSPEPASDEGPLSPDMDEGPLSPAMSYSSEGVGCDQDSDKIYMDANPNASDINNQRTEEGSDINTQNSKPMQHPVSPEPDQEMISPDRGQGQTVGDISSSVSLKETDSFIKQSDSGQIHDEEVLPSNSGSAEGPASPDEGEINTSNSYLSNSELANELENSQSENKSKHSRKNESDSAVISEKCHVQKDSIAKQTTAKENTSDKESLSDGELKTEKVTTPLTSTNTDSRRKNESPATRSEPNKASSAKAGLHDDHGELDYYEDVDDVHMDVQKKGDGEADQCGEGGKELEDGAIEDEDGEINDDEDGDEDGELNDEDCEEGEIKEPDGRKPFVPPVCRFYNRGHCTWGLNCRFLHPGVNDKGNYSLIEPPSQMLSGRSNLHARLGVPWGRQEKEKSDAQENELPPPPVEEPVYESAWERGLRHAKELMKKANKRKETDTNFEEKKMNLSIEDQEQNKENDFKPYPKDPYYDQQGYDEEELCEGNNGSPLQTWQQGHYENFEVRWTSNNRDYIPPSHAVPPNAYRDREREPVRARDPRGMMDRRDNNHYRSPEGRYERKAHHHRHHHRQRRHDRPHDAPREPPPAPIKSSVREERNEKTSVKPHVRSDEWRDPWRRSKSPKIRRGSLSRSRSRGRRRKRSYSRGSRHSSSSSSRSSRSRSSSYSSYSSRSSYSRSSSFSSRSRSRSASPRPSGAAKKSAGPTQGASLAGQKKVPPKPGNAPIGAPSVKGQTTSPVKKKTAPVNNGKGPVRPGRGIPKTSSAGGAERGRKMERTAGQDRGRGKASLSSSSGSSFSRSRSRSSSSSRSRSGSASSRSSGSSSWSSSSSGSADSANLYRDIPGPNRNSKQSISSRKKPSKSGAAGVGAPADKTSKEKTQKEEPKRPPKQDKEKPADKNSERDKMKEKKPPTTSQKTVQNSPTKQPSAPVRQTSASSRQQAAPSRQNSSQAVSVPKPQPVGPVRSGPPPSAKSDAPKVPKNQVEKTVPPGDSRIKSTVSSSKGKDPLKLSGQKPSIKLTLLNKPQEKTVPKQPQEKTNQNSHSGATSKKRAADVSSSPPPPAKRPAKTASPPKAVIEKERKGVKLTLNKPDKAPARPVAQNVKNKPDDRTAKPAAPTTTKKPESPQKAVSKPAPAPAVKPKKSTSSRREELLKQLKAVEDAIARKRSKIN